MPAFRNMPKPYSLKDVKIVKFCIQIWIRLCGTCASVFNSYARGKTYDTYVGSGWLIPGMDQALLGMCVNEHRIVSIPSRLAYGDTGTGIRRNPPTSIDYRVVYSKHDIAVAYPVLDVESVSHSPPMCFWVQTLYLCGCNEGRYFYSEISLLPSWFWTSLLWVPVYNLMSHLKESFNNMNDLNSCSWCTKFPLFWQYNISCVIK